MELLDTRSVLFCFCSICTGFTFCQKEYEIYKGLAVF